jgi:hypothetical protein
MKCRMGIGGNTFVADVCIVDLVWTTSPGAAAGGPDLESGDRLHAAGRARESCRFTK